MTPQAVQDLIAYGEGPTVEFKQAFTTDVVKTIAAFANSAAGTILIGINDEALCVGIQEDPRRLEERIIGLCRTVIKPSVTPAIEVITMDGGDVLIISVPEGDRKPYTANDICYIRAGSTSRRADPDELRRLTLESDVTLYERTSLRDASFDQFDLGRLERFIERRAPGAILINGLQVREIAVTLRLAAKVGDVFVPTVAGLLLFGRHPQWLRPEWGIRAVRFSGNSLDAPILDMMEIEGTVDRLIEDTLAFVKRNMRTAALFPDETLPQRQDVPEYPLLAVREAIVNAVAHRDYSLTGQIAVRMFEDRLEVFDPGRLPTTIDLNMMTQRGGSFPRNPTFFRVMRELGLAEEIGRGLIRIRRELRDLGSEEPTFFADEMGFTVTLPSRHRV